MIGLLINSIMNVICRFSVKYLALRFTKTLTCIIIYLHKVVTCVLVNVLVSVYSEHLENGVSKILHKPYHAFGDVSRIGLFIPCFFPSFEESAQQALKVRCLIPQGVTI